MERPIARQSPATALALALLAATTLLAHPARAGEWWSDEHFQWEVPPRARSEDPPPALRTHDEVLERSGAIMTGFALGTLAGGGVTLVVAEHGTSYCGLTGCYRRSNLHARMAAASMFTGGVAMGLIAVPCWLAGRMSKPWVRRSDRRMATGIALTTAGTGALAISALMLGALANPEFLGDDDAEDPFGRQSRPLAGGFVSVLVQGVAGAGMFATGVALWGSGARTPRRRSRWGEVPDAELHVGAGNASLDLRF